MSIQIESTTNGVWISTGGQSQMMLTTDVSKLMDCLKDSLQRYGKWSVETTDRDVAACSVCGKPLQLSKCSKCHHHTFPTGFCCAICEKLVHEECYKMVGRQVHCLTCISQGRQYIQSGYCCPRCGTTSSEPLRNHSCF